MNIVVYKKDGSRSFYDGVVSINCEPDLKEISFTTLTSFGDRLIHVKHKNTLDKIFITGVDE